MDKKNRSKQTLIALLGILSLVLITVGVTYAVFTYTKLGETENTITTGTLKFLYTENTGVGNGISITNALPVSDSVGKAYTTDGYVFDFKVEGANSGNTAIPYELTLRKKADSALAEKNIKVYLTDMTGDADSELLAPKLYSALTNTSIDVGTNVEKTIYKSSIPATTTDYTKNFRLRMWIDSATDFSDEQNNNKSFTATVNVYSGAIVVVE